MELKDQVCSLELSKKLKELGFKQESLFYWIWNDVDLGDTIVHKEKIENSDDFKEGLFVSAYTVAELGEMFPSKIYTRKYLGKNHPTTEGNKDYIENMKKNNWYAIKYDDNMDNLQGHKKEADARAKMLIYLKENNLI